MEDGRDRRVHARAPLNMLVQFRLSDMGEFMREVAKGQIRLDDGSKLIEGLGQVVHVNPPDHAVPGMGVEFVNLDAESRKLIDQIVAERLTEIEQSE